MIASNTCTPVYYNMWRVAIVLCSTGVALGGLPLETKVERALEATGIIPEVVSIPPSITVKVEYGYEKSVKLGTVLKPKEFADKPSSVSFVSDPFKMYCLILFDADSGYPYDNDGSYFLLWMVVNIPGGDIQRGETLYEYIDLTPYSNFGNHRNVFLVYEQPDHKHFETNKYNQHTMGDRGDFILQHFLSDNDISPHQLLGANFFWVRYPEPEPMLNESDYQEGDDK